MLVWGHVCDGVCRGVCEGDVLVYECNEAPSASVCTVSSECCVTRKLRCFFVLLEFCFLECGNVYVVFV